MVILHPKNRKGANQQLKFSIHRVKAYIWPEGSTEAIEGFCFLSDMKHQEVGMYLDRKFKLNKVILIAFLDKESQPYRMKSVWAKELKDSLSHVNKGCTWRLGLAPAFASEDEAKRYSAFLDDYKAQVSKTAKSDEEQPTMKEASPDSFSFDDDDVA